MMNLSISIQKQIKLNDFIVFASLPDMGKVGGLVSEFLIKELSAEKFAEIKILEKPWVKNEKGLITPIVDIYTLFVNLEKKIVILSGKEQPQDSNNLFNLCISFIHIIKDIGNPKMIYTAGGYHQPQLTEAPHVYGVSTHEELNVNLKELGIRIFQNEIEVITWFNGVIMGIAAEMKLKAIGLFSEIVETKEKQPLAAKSILKAFSKLENIPINTDQFDLEFENQILENNKFNGSRKRRSGPGIG